jgi:replicative DNA helicase
MALSQLSRAPEQRTKPRPRLSDLRESGAIEQDADLVVFLYREERSPDDQSEGDDLMEIIIGKNRNGPTDTVQLRFLKRFMRFEDHDPRQAPF